MTHPTGAPSLVPEGFDHLVERSETAVQRAADVAPRHTPGPWQRSGVRQKLGNEDCIVVGPDGLSIAFLPIGRRPHEQAGAIADARLIAAAPELLAACKSALYLLKGREHDQFLRDVIAKAEAA